MNQTIRRDHYLQKLIDRKENGLVKVITGIRRCGKSFLLFNLFYDYLIESGVKEEQIISIALHLHDFHGASVVLSARHVKHHFLQNKCSKQKPF